MTSIVKTEPSGVLPFEQQPREGNRAFEAFKVYLEMGSDRSLRELARRLDKSLTLIGRWSVKYDWHSRVQAHGAYLAELQRKDPRLRIHSISTATDINIGQIRELTSYLYERCPQMDHHNLALIRGDRKNPALATPNMNEYQALYEYIRRLWAPREEGRYGGIVEPMLQWAKVETLARRTQVVPCTAGIMTGVVSANGDVSVCELHEPLGNLRQQSFPEIWHSEKAKAVRESIARKECHCTTEVFLWPSVTFQPGPLAKAFVGARAWRFPKPLEPFERQREVRASLRWDERVDLVDDDRVDGCQELASTRRQQEEQ